MRLNVFNLSRYLEEPFVEMVRVSTLRYLIALNIVVVDINWF